MPLTYRALRRARRDAAGQPDATCEIEAPLQMSPLQPKEDPMMGAPKHCVQHTHTGDPKHTRGALRRARPDEAGPWHDAKCKIEEPLQMSPLQNVASETDYLRFERN